MYDNILLPVDLGDDHSKEKALPAAVEFCRAFGARLHIMSVVPDFGVAAVSSFFPDDFADKAVAQTTEGLHKLADAHAGDIDCSVIAAYGNIYEEILRVSRDINADLIVMASNRPKLEDYLLGPNAARVVRHAPVSVLVVR